MTKKNSFEKMKIITGRFVFLKKESNLKKRNKRKLVQLLDKS